MIGAALCFLLDSSLNKDFDLSDAVIVAAAAAGQYSLRSLSEGVINVFIRAAARATFLSVMFTSSLLRPHVNVDGAPRSPSRMVLFSHSDRKSTCPFSVKVSPACWAFFFGSPLHENVLSLNPDSDQSERVLPSVAWTG